MAQKKLTPKQHQRELAKLGKVVQQEIAGQSHDLLIMLEILTESYDYTPEGDDSYQQLIAYWSKEVKAAFREFVRERNKLNKRLK